jgi:hypothetical protein
MNLTAVVLDFDLRLAHPQAWTEIQAEVASFSSALGLNCLAIELRLNAGALEGLATFDLDDEEGQPMSTLVTVPLVH